MRLLPHTLLLLPFVQLSPPVLSARRPRRPILTTVVRTTHIGNVKKLGNYVLFSKEMKKGQVGTAEQLQLLKRVKQEMEKGEVGHKGKASGLSEEGASEGGAEGTGN